MVCRAKKGIVVLLVILMTFSCFIPGALAEKKQKVLKVTIEQNLDTGNSETNEILETVKTKPKETKSEERADAKTKKKTPKTINISGTNTVLKGKTVKLSAKVSPSGASQSVTWKTSNKKIATVSSKGIVTGKKTGQVKITATSTANKKIQASITITVVGNKAKKVTVTAPSDTLTLSKKTMSLSAKAEPVDAAQEFTWKSSNPKVATVDNNGVVTALTAGTVKITATAKDGSKKKSTIKIKIIKGDNVTLDIYWVGNGDNESVRAGVEEAINKYIEPLIGAKVSFHIIGWGDWNDKAVKALQSGEKMDLIFTADWEGYGEEVSAGLLMPLDDLVEQYGQGIKDTLPQTFLEGVKVNGVLYAIPTNKELCIPQGFIINKTAAEAIGWDVQADDPSIMTTKDLEPWLKKYKEMFPEKYPYLMDGAGGRWADEPWVPDWAGMAGNSVSMKMAADKNGKFDETIYSIYETPEQEEHIRLMYDWGEKGYISPEADLSSFDYYGTFGSGDFLVFSQPLKGNGIKADEVYTASATTEFEYVEITMQPKYVVTNNAGGSMFGIPVTSRNPEAAMKYLNLMHSDATLVNLMLFGEEGTNYTKVNDQQVELTDLNWYGVHSGAWTVGNTKLQYVLTSEDPEKNELLQEYGKDALPTASLGFRFVKDNVSDQIAAVDAVVTEMGNPLMCGQVNPDDPSLGINAMRNALAAAGMKEILAEAQKQYDAWKKVK